MNYFESSGDQPTSLGPLPIYIGLALNRSCTPHLLSQINLMLPLDFFIPFPPLPKRRRHRVPNNKLIVRLKTLPTSISPKNHPKFPFFPAISPVPLSRLRTPPPLKRNQKNKKQKKSNSPSTIPQPPHPNPAQTHYSHNKTPPPPSSPATASAKT